MEDEELLLALLNSAPVVRGKPADVLESPAGAEIAQRFGGTGSKAETRHLQHVRGALQAVIRGETDRLEELGTVISRATLAPEVGPGGVQWLLQAPDDERLGVRAALAWSAVMAELPGRLRACANDECNLFLVDHSRPGTAKWCSMGTCGNRMKARAHASRQRSATSRGA